MADLDFPTSPSTNDTYTDDNAAVWQWDGEKWDVITRSTKRAFKGAKVMLSTDFSLTATSTAISWATEEFDTAALWSASQPTRFSITENGFYRINTQITTTAGGTASSYTISIRKNGTEVSSTTVASNQFVLFDDVLQLAVGDYIEVFAAESTAAGSIESDTSFVEIIQEGLSLGTGISTWSAFSGARTYMTSAFSTTSTETAITFTDTEFDQNADVLGSEYWASGTASRLTAKVTGYYRIKGVFETSSAGSADSYTFSLKKNGTTTLETGTLGPNSTISIDEIYTLTSNDYLEMYVQNSDNTGSVANTAYIEITRKGV